MSEETASSVGEDGRLPREPIRMEEHFAAACMALLALITFANVVLRYLSDESIAWTEEISIAVMVVMTLAAAAAAVARERHVRIEYYLEQGSPGRRRCFALFATATVVVFFLGLALLSARMVFDELRFGETSPGIGVPKWWYTVWVPLLCILIALRGTGLWLRQWRER